MQLSSKARKALASGLAASTVLWAAAGIVPSIASAAVHSDGCLVLSGGVVWLITGGTRRGFTSAEVFMSHGYNFGQVVAATAEDVALAVGPIMTYADGTLVKGPNDPLVYLVTGGQKRPFVSGAVFTGRGYSFSNIQQAPANTFADLPTGANIDNTTERHGAGVVVNASGTIWLMTATGRMGYPSMAVFSSYGKSLLTVVAANAADLALPDQGAVAMRAACTGGGGTPPPPVSGSLSVSLASSNPAANSVIADTTSGHGAQALMPMLAVNFTAGSTAAVITEVKVTRGGISANADLSNIYLYDGNTRLAEYTSYASGVATFSNASGLFTVPASSTRVITVKADLANGTASGKTINLSLTSVSLSGGASVSGLPISGNNMTTATVADLGRLTVSHVSSPTSVDPGVSGFEAWRLNFVANDQDVEVHKVNLTMVGTIAPADVQNIKLMAAGVQVGSTQQIGANNEVLFDLSSSPLKITSGQTKVVTVNVDVVAGTSRNFRFSIRKSSDISAKDLNYGVWLKPNQSDTLTVIEPGSNTSINNGALTVTRASDSPTGTVANNANGVTLAKFNFKAAGEAVKVTTIVVEAVVSEDQQNLDDGKVYIDGGQVGSTVDFDSDATDDGDFTDSATDAVGAGTDEDTSISLGNTFIIPAGQTKVLTLVADTQDGDGNALAASSTIRLSVGGIVAQGQTSLATVTVGTADGNTLTAGAGTLTTSKNLAMADATSTAPTGVQGTTNVKIGSFLVTAGVGEGASITQIVLKDDLDDTGSAGTSTMADVFQNLRLMQGSTQIGSTVATLTDTTATTYTFSVSPAITVNAGAQATFDVYADVLSSVSANPLSDINADTADGVLILDSVAATGVNTSSSADDTTDRQLQNLYIGTSGTFSVTSDSASPAGTLVAGTGTEMEVARFTLKETTGAEGVAVSQIVVTDTSSASTSFSNVKLFVDGVQLGTTQNLNAASSGTATFSGLSYVVPAGATKTLVVKATPNAYPNGTAGSTHNFRLAASAVTANGQVSNTSVSGPATAQTSNTHMWARTSLAAAGAVQGATSSRVRNANDKLETLTFTSGTPYPAAIRGALQLNDEADGGAAGNNWDAVGTSAVSFTTNNVIDGTNSARVTEDGASAANDHWWTDTGASSGLQNYSKVSFWITSSAAKAAGDLTIKITSTEDSSDNGTFDATTQQTTNIPALSANTKTYVELAVSTATSASRYLNFVVAANPDNAATIDIDNIRFYNDSVTVGLTGNLKATLGSNGKVVYLKDTSGVVKMVGYASTTVQDTASAVLTVGDDIGNAAATVAGDINFSSSGSALDLIFSSVDHVLTDAGAAAEALTATINLGNATTAGDIRWYDAGVAATSPLTFVNGSTPIQASVSYQ